MFDIIYFLENYKDLNEIDENLWLGNSFAAGDIKDLKEKGITKILSVMNDNPNEYNIEDEFKHKTIEIMDMNHANIIQYFGECFNFIKGDEKILIHCAAGPSRSATIVIAYLMWKKKMKFDEALKYVQNRRFVVRPNKGFKDQLKLFEKLLIENDYNIDKINFKEVKWLPPDDLPF